MKHRPFSSQSGSAFLALFGAVAMLGVVGAGLNMVIRGPVTTMADVTKRTVAESSMLSSAKLAVAMAPSAQANSGDCDNDGYVEPFPFRSAGSLPKPTGGGYIPAQLGNNTVDPWATEFGYCAWDHGPKTTTDNVAGCGGSGANRLKGANNGNQSAVVIISAGKDRTFQTTCNAFVDANADGNPDTPLVNRPAGSDDLVTGYTYAEANNVGGGGLWQLKNGSPSTATIGKDIEISGSASFSGGLSLSGGLILAGDPGNDSVTGPCNAANDQQLRRNTSTTPPTIEICHFAGAARWQPVYSVLPTAMPTPGSACAAADAGTFRMGKPASLPDGYMVTCSGSVWNTLLKYNLSTGIAEVPLSPANTKQFANKGYVDLAINNAKLPVCEANEYYIRGASGYSCYCDRPGPPFLKERTSSTARMWQSIASSKDGMKVAATSDYIYTSTDGGETWTQRTSAGSRVWRSIASSSDGTILAAAAANDYIYTSADGGATWTQRTASGSRNWKTIASSVDNSTLIAVPASGYIYTSSDGGATWSERTASGSRSWWGVDVSDDGTKMAGFVFGGYAYTSVNSGAAWTERTGAGSRYWTTGAISADGTKIAALAESSVYTSGDNGATWTQRTTAGSASWSGLTASSDGTMIAAISPMGLAVSRDSGVTWVLDKNVGEHFWKGLAGSDNLSKLHAATSGSPPTYGAENLFSIVSVCKGCMVRPANVALTPGQTGTFFASATAPYGTCTSEVRICNGGVLSGTSGYASCKGIFESIGTGRFGACALTSLGIAWCWGTDAYNPGSTTGSGYLGNGTSGSKLIPTLVSGNHIFTKISAAYYHSCALKSDGSAWCWGNNYYGQLGDNTTADKNIPTIVSGGHTFQSISVGASHTCALKSDGSAWCWGLNANGRIGDGTSTNRLVPTAVTGSHSFSSLSTGAHHTCGLKSNGSAWCWGLNDGGQIGDNTAASKSSPTAVLGGHFFTSIASGGRHTCATKSDGSVFCWGSNASGQIGDNTTINKSVPTAVSGGRLFTSIGASHDNSCGLESNGSAWCWGRNADGLLGDGTTTDRSVPTAVSGGHQFKSLALGYISTCGLKTDGLTLCWGYGLEGQIGDNTTTSKLIPTPIYQP